MPRKTDVIKCMPQRGKSTEADWLTWLKLLNKKLPPLDAKLIWTKAWNLRGDSKGFSLSFRKEMKAAGVSVKSNRVWAFVIGIRKRKGYNSFFVCCH